MLAAALGLAGVGAWKLLAMPVERVVVTGDLEYVSRDELMSVISESLSGGFLWLDLQAVRTPLEALPWVHRAVVRRQWPDSIEVRVIEQRAIAAWGEGAFLNHAGDVFTPAGAIDGGSLPELAGPAGSQGELMLRYKQVQERLQPLGLTVVALEMNPRGGLLATLAGGGELVFGRDDLERKLDRLELIYREQLSPRRGELARVDLRYNHGAAVAWKQNNNQES
jgi:cell division protein FtsQ